MSPPIPAAHRCGKVRGICNPAFIFQITPPLTNLNKGLINLCAFGLMVTPGGLPSFALRFPPSRNLRSPDVPPLSGLLLLRRVRVDRLTGSTLWPAIKRGTLMTVGGNVVREENHQTLEVFLPRLLAALERDGNSRCCRDDMEVRDVRSDAAGDQNG